MLAAVSHPCKFCPIVQNIQLNFCTRDIEKFASIYLLTGFNDFLTKHNLVLLRYYDIIMLIEALKYNSHNNISKARTIVLGSPSSTVVSSMCISTAGEF